MTRFRLAAIALTLLLSSNAWADLKTFDVDPQYRQEMYSALRDILQNLARVELLPSGQILVNAPPEVLQQVEQVLQTIRNRPTAAAPRVDLRYWAVLGTPMVVANPPGTATPSALSDVLGELERLHGDLHFRVIGTAALTSDSGQHAQVNGMALEVEQTAFVQGDTLNATIDMSLEADAGDLGRLIVVGQEQVHIGGVTVRTALRRGEFVVLGQSDFTGRSGQGGGGLNGPVFYIVHWAEE